MIDSETLSLLFKREWKVVDIETLSIDHYALKIIVYLRVAYKDGVGYNALCSALHMIDRLC
jgi:hypothetical protein